MFELSLRILRNTVLAGVGAISAAHAAPLDSPDTIYVNGQPCGSFCQSYLGINRPGPRIEQLPVRAPVPSFAVRHDRPAKLAPRAIRRVAEKSAQPKIPMPVARMQDGRRPQSAASVKLETPRRAASRPWAESATADDAAPRRDLTIPPTVAIEVDRHERVDAKSPSKGIEQTSLQESNRGNEAKLSYEQNRPNTQEHREPRPAAQSSEPLAAPADLTNAPVSAPDTIRESRAGDAASPSLAPAPMEIASLDRQQPAATPSPSTEPTPEIDISTGPKSIDSTGAASAASTQSPQEAASPDREQHVAALSSPAKAVASKIETAAPPTIAERRVAVIMVRPEILSISDLTSKDIAIDVRQAPSRDVVRTALATAGANETNLTDGRTKALDRLLGGEVSAAVLAVLSQSAAENFPNIAGFRLFRIPLAAN